MMLKKLTALLLCGLLLMLCGCAAIEKTVTGYEEGFSEAFSRLEADYNAITIPDAVIEAADAGTLLYAKTGNQRTHTLYGLWLESGDILTLQRYLNGSQTCDIAMQGLEGEAAVRWLGDRNPYAAMTPWVNGLPLTAVQIAEQEPAEGDVVYICGYHPGTVSPVVHAAILDNTDYAADGEHYYYVKSPLPLGSVSFGMVLNENGELLGLLNGYYEDHEASTCIPLPELKAFIEGLPDEEPEGIPVVQVVGIEPDSIFRNTPLMVGDVIYAIDGVNMAYLSDVQAAKDTMSPGDTVTFTFLRLTDTDSVVFDIDVTFPAGKDVIFGLTVQEMVAVEK